MVIYPPKHKCYSKSWQADTLLQYILKESTWETLRWTRFFVLYSSNLPSCDHNQWGVELCFIIRYQRLSLRLLVMCSHFDVPAAILSGRLCWSSAHRCKNAPPMTKAQLNQCVYGLTSTCGVSKYNPHACFSWCNTAWCAKQIILPGTCPRFSWNRQRICNGHIKIFWYNEEVWHTFNTDTDTAFYWLITTAIFSSYGLQWSHEVWNAQATCFKHQPCRIGQQ